MSTKPPSRVVFVGNIPYGLSEEQISDIFSSAGKVLNFRLVYDRETGRPKGFGFAEYPDADSASSAVRNLNDYEIMGRKLRVDFSNEGTSDDNNDSRGGGGGDRDRGDRGDRDPYSSYQFGGGPNGGAPPPGGGSSLPPLPPGKELPPGVTCTDAISRTLNTLPPAQLLDILSQMKALATNEPARATELLAQAPQLAYAVFQALLLMGLVSPEAINSVVDAGGPPPVAAPPLPVGAGYVPMPAGYPGVAATGTPPVAAPYQPPPVAAAAPGQDPDALMAMVLQLPQETIDQLPEAERQQIMALRASYQGQRR